MSELGVILDENIIIEAPRSDGAKQERVGHSRSARIMGGIGIGAALFVGLGVASELGSIAEAHADTGNTITVAVGGAGDPESAMFGDTLVTSGAVNPNQLVEAHYPAEMGPFVGTTPTNESTAIGVANVEQIVREHPGANIVLRGFSEGDFVTNAAKKDLADQGIYVQVINAGDGNGATGILNNPLAGTFQPIVEGMGIVKTPPTPGTLELADGRDVWAATANGSIGDIITDGVGIPQFHRVPAPNEVPVQDFSVDGVEYKIYDTPIVVPDGAEYLPLLAVDPNAVPAPAPEVAPDDQGPAPEAAPVDAPAPDVAPADQGPAPVSNTPEFSGEQACVAADGSEYYTPGDAPC